jgi:predicted membrane chloride channel (bestrophin family)
MIDLYRKFIESDLPYLLKILIAGTVVFSCLLVVISLISFILYMIIITGFFAYIFFGGITLGAILLAGWIVIGEEI